MLLHAFLRDTPTQVLCTRKQRLRNGLAEGGKEARNSGYHLLRDEVEKGVAILELQQRFGLLEAHAGAQTAVELEHHLRDAQRANDRRAGLGGRRDHSAHSLDSTSVAQRRDAGSGQYVHNTRHKFVAVSRPFSRCLSIRSIPYTLTPNRRPCQPKRVETQRRCPRALQA
eukprot:3189496-Pleurochrysis_carterae.AAC.3